MTYSLKDAAVITKVNYTTLVLNVRKGILTNPVKDSDLYEILTLGWQRFRITRKRAMEREN